jgi:nicotinamidase-related amidase
LSERFIINKAGTAVLIMDFQNDILPDIPEERRKPLILNAVRVLKASREAGMEVIHVANIFRKGYPEVNTRNRIYKEVKARGMYMEGSQGGAIYFEVSPLENEIFITKHRASAFFNTDLDVILRAKGITQLVMMGVATEGCVLSTVRQAFDLDYLIMVISDACADPDQTIHEALTEKIFVREAVVVSTEEFVSAVKRDSK